MLVSVIIPVYNRAALIGETLQTVKRQAYRPVELLLVDNCSDDSSLSVCRGFAAEESGEGFEVKVLQERKRGASACRNRGAGEAAGRWLCFFDSDDLMDPLFISDAAAAVAPETQLVAGAAKMETGGRLRRRAFSFSGRAEDQILAGGLSTQSFIVRSDFFRSVGGWDESLSRWNDWELGVRMLLAAPAVAWLRGKSYHTVRVHSDSITGDSFAASFPALMAACRAVERDLRLRRAAPSCMEALAFRAYWLAGVLRGEGASDCAAAAARYAGSLASSRAVGVFGRALMRYTALGGRGAWRAALTALRPFCR